MKLKYFLLLAFSLVLLASCRKDGASVETVGSDVLVFDPVISGNVNETKGAMITGTTYNYSTLGPFWVKAYNKNDNTAKFGYTKVMPLQHEKGSKNTYWTTVDDSGNLLEYMWKKDQLMYFYAYTNLPSAGATVTSTNWYSQNLAYDVTQVQNASAQKDILLGLGANQKPNDAGRTKEGYTGKFAEITFTHPLSAVKFKLGTIEGWTTGDKITSIKMSGVYSSGSYYNNDSGSSWKSLSGSTEVNMTNSSGLPIDSSDIIGETFFLIPQNLGTQNVTVKVALSVGGVSKNVQGVLKSKPEDKPWETGKYYTYSLNITNAAEDIVLSVNLADWGTINKDEEILSGSVMTYGEPSVDPWGNQDNGSIPYTD